MRMKNSNSRLCLHLLSLLKDERMRIRILELTMESSTILTEFDDIALQKRMKFNLKRLVSSYLFMALDHCQTTEVSKVLSSLSISSSLGNGL